MQQAAQLVTMTVAHRQAIDRNYNMPSELHCSQPASFTGAVVLPVSILIETISAKTI